MNNDIHHLIDSYFAGETTLQQEQRLRKLLLENAGSGDPAVEEALAVMSFTAASRPEKREIGRASCRERVCRIV